MIEVKIFGSEPPCAKCKQVEAVARKAAEGFPGRVSVQKLSALSPEGVALGILTTPVVVVNDSIVAQGRIPEVDELIGIYSNMESS